MVSFLRLPLSRFVAATIAVLLLIGGTSQVSAAPDRPLVFIPGMLGSRLCDKATGEVVWGGLSSYSHFSDLALPLTTGELQLKHKSCGIIENVEILGPWKVHQYDDLIDTLTKHLGYKLGDDLFVFDYDWRISNTDTAAALATWISQSPIGDQDFDIIAHSMGGIVARLLVSKPEFAERVKRLVTLGTPYRGSAQTFRLLDSGFGFWENLAARGLENIRLTALTFRSAYELLPNYPSDDCCRWRDLGAVDTDFDPLDPEVWTHFAFVPDIFTDEVGKDWLRQTLEHARGIQQEITQPPPDGIRAYPIVGSLIDTDYRVTIDRSSGQVVRFQQTRGDGTVIQRSAANWDLPEARPSTTEHARLFANDSVRQVLSYIFANGDDPTNGQLNGRYFLIDGQGNPFEVSTLRYEVMPQVALPGEEAKLILTLTGTSADAGTALAAADLSGIQVRINASDSAPLPLSVSIADGPALSVQFKFTAPQAEGAHSLFLTLPGIVELQDVFVVLPITGAAP